MKQICLTEEKDLYIELQIVVVKSEVCLDLLSNELLLQGCGFFCIISGDNSAVLSADAHLSLRISCSE